MAATAPPPSYSAVPQESPKYYPGPTGNMAAAPPPCNPGAYQAQAYPGPQPPPQMAQNTTVVVNQPRASTVVCAQFGSGPTPFHCPYCNNHVTSYVEYTPGLLTWLIVGLLCLLGFFILFFIPLLVDGLKDVEHYCPVCKNRVGSYKRM